MIKVHKSVLLGYSAAQMFQLVERVEDYPKFLPWCGGVTVGERTPESLIASILIDYHGVKQQFTTHNQHQFPVAMQMALVEGPFKQLRGSWEFKALREDACKVEFTLQYEFSSRLLEHVIGPVFSMIANSFIDAFCKRAEAVYG